MQQAEEKGLIYMNNFLILIGGLGTVITLILYLLNIKKQRITLAKLVLVSLAILFIGLAVPLSFKDKYAGLFPKDKTWLVVNLDEKKEFKNQVKKMDTLTGSKYTVAEIYTKQWDVYQYIEEKDYQLSEEEAKEIASFSKKVSTLFNQTYKNMEEEGFEQPEDEQFFRDFKGANKTFRKLTVDLRDQQLEEAKQLGQVLTQNHEKRQNMLERLEKTDKKNP